MFETYSTKEVAKRLGVCRRTVFRLVKHRKIPQPYRLSRKTVRWAAREFDRWLLRIQEIGGP